MIRQAFLLFSVETKTDMHSALKLARPVQLQQQSLSSFSLSNANRNITLAPPSLKRFVQTAASERPDEMDSNKQSESAESKKPTQSNDTMSCFGEGYASRSDEEGFGGIYGGNQYLNKNDDDDKNGQEFDHDQGSHVKEKETSRNQKAE